MLRALAELLPSHKDIRLEDHLDIDLGFDSLKRVELQVALERQLGNLPEMVMGEVVTVRDVIEQLRGLEQGRVRVVTRIQLKRLRPFVMAGSTQEILAISMQTDIYF